MEYFKFVELSRRRSRSRRLKGDIALEILRLQLGRVSSADD